MSYILDFFQKIGAVIFVFFEKIGGLAIFSFYVVVRGVKKPIYFKEIGKHIIEIGYYSLPVVGMTAIFTGAVLALQSHTGFSRFSAESSVATVVVLSITRELGPVLAGLMVSGRIGASIAAEIATMKVTEQIDALRTLSTNPIKFLISPRTIAAVLSLPFLVLVADIIGILGGYIVATQKLGFSPGTYLQKTFEYLEFIDVFSGLVKAAIFGFIISIIASYCGYNSEKGAIGVGRATTNSVVISSMMILFANYLTTEIFFTN